MNSNLGIRRFSIIILIFTRCLLSAAFTNFLVVCSCHHRAYALCLFLGTIERFPPGFLLSRYHSSTQFLLYFSPVTKIETARLSSKPYSSIAGIVAYCPVINYGTEKFIFADTRKMLTRFLSYPSCSNILLLRHKPETITIIPNEECNIGEMVIHPFSFLV